MNDRVYPDAADGRPPLPMEVELWSAGCDHETARFVAGQLRDKGYQLIQPGDIGWASMASCPVGKVVDLWCVCGDEPAAKWGENDISVVGVAVPGRYKSPDLGWGGNQSAEGVPNGPRPDLVPVAWKWPDSKCPPELVAEALGIPLEPPASDEED